MFDGRASSNLTILLLDLWRTALGNEWAKFTAGRENVIMYMTNSEEIRQSHEHKVPFCVFKVAYYCAEINSACAV